MNEKEAQKSTLVTSIPLNSSKDGYVGERRHWILVTYSYVIGLIINHGHDGPKSMGERKLKQLLEECG